MVLNKNHLVLPLIKQKPSSFFRSHSQHASVEAGLAKTQGRGRSDGLGESDNKACSHVGRGKTCAEDTCLDGVTAVETVRGTCLAEGYYTSR